MSPVRVEGKSTVLRELRIEDAQEVHSILGDKRVGAWLSGSIWDRAGVELMLIENGTQESLGDDDDRVEYHLGIVLPDDDRAIGLVRLELTGSSAGRLGYAIHHDHWGHGYGTDAVRSMLDLAFTRIGLHRVSATVDPTNTASIALLARVGMRREGTIRDDVHVDGEWRDSQLFSILEGEWGPDT